MIVAELFGGRAGGGVWSCLPWHRRSPRTLSSGDRPPTNEVDEMEPAGDAAAGEWSLPFDTTVAPLPAERQPLGSWRAELLAFGAYVEAARQWGRDERAKLGL